MGAKVTNEGKGVTSKTSDHTYISGPPDVCWDPPQAVQVPHVNHVKTDKAVEHTSGKTLFQNGNVVRVGEALEPSEPDHGDNGGGGGVTSKTYRKEARATKGSPSVRAEGKAPARTDDPTTQNHGNTTGTIKQSVSPGELVDNPEEWLKRCSYKTSQIKCKHNGFTPQRKIDVWRGNTITVEAQRYNAKEPDQDPVCAQMPHMKWKVTRTGGVTELGADLPPLEGTFEGDTLVLPTEYTAPLVGLTLVSDQSRNLSDDAKRQYIGMKNARAQELAEQRGSSRVESQDTQQAYKETKLSIEAKDEQLRDSPEQAARDKQRNRVQNLATFAQFLVAWRAAQNPVKIMILGNACSGGISYEVNCYPNSKYSFQLPLDIFIKAGQFVSKTFDFIQTTAKLGNLNVEGSITVPGDVSIGLEFQWKEQDAGEGEATAPYFIKLESEISIAGQIFEIKFEVMFPFANLLVIIPVGGTLAAKALNWVIKKLGADAGVGLGVQIGASAALAFKLAWSENKKWEMEGSFKIPIDIKVYGFARVRWESTVLIEFQMFVIADPAFIIKASAEGVTVGMDDCMIRVGFSGVIHVETWFYTFHEEGQFFPESMTTRIKEIVFGKLFGN
jgi:hypothetical protein